MDSRVLPSTVIGYWVSNPRPKDFRVRPNSDERFGCSNLGQWILGSRQAQ
ncbi:Hypothetical protein FKW44_001711 [Caligus rogercresseyi]|uniref:Uncharacterized protein n=1 Tax=Caligus rogercresseyi TaxID=217165 RepID=A0A7T8KJB9_CALRO|nr:Hypothetical protein FKW44_001711 [Caligus rogercresseyi]